MTGPNFTYHFYIVNDLVVHCVRLLDLVIHYREYESYIITVYTNKLPLIKHIQNESIATPYRTDDNHNVVFYRDQ